MNWKDKVAIITGSSYGIGKAIAFELGRKGARVVINARHEEKLRSTAKELEEEAIVTFPVAGDISIPEKCQEIVDAVIDKFGRLDILINNAGATADESTVAEISPFSFRKLVEVNLLGSVFMTQASIPHITTQKGNIIFISSVAGIHGIGGHAAYSSSKMALTAVTESLRKELHKKHVHIGIAYLGFTENSASKVVYDQQGNVIPIPERSVGKADTPQHVAKKIAHMIAKRRKKEVFSLLGKLNAIMNRFFPRFVFFVLNKAYWKARKT